jgi:cytoskeletal protein CcmA (bactofilin family)
MIFSKGNEKLESFIGANTDFQEGLNVKGTLRVDGRIDGKLNAEYLILGETAVVKGEVTAKKIIVGERLKEIYELRRSLRLSQRERF